MHGAALRSMRALLEGHWDDGRARRGTGAARGRARSRRSWPRRSTGVADARVRSEQLRLGELIGQLRGDPPRGAATCPPGARRWPGPTRRPAASDAARAELAPLRSDRLRRAAARRQLRRRAGDARPRRRRARRRRAGRRARAAAAPARRPTGSCSASARRRSGPSPTPSASATCWPAASTWRSATSRLAIAKCRAMRARPYEAHASLRLARALVRARRARRRRARGRARSAPRVAIAQELGMPRLLRDAATSSQGRRRA